MPSEPVTQVFPVRDYDLAATLSSGQAFRWHTTPNGGWESVVGGRWTMLSQVAEGVAVTAIGRVEDYKWITEYLQLGIDVQAIINTFPPQDAQLTAAVNACRGLRLLRQEPWETLATFILSSTKQIVQIRQVVDTLARAFGVPVPVPPDRPQAFAFPSPQIMAAASEKELRACKMGFRAPYLKAAASAVAAGQLDLGALRRLHLDNARQALMQLPGVGPKIANCVLLFAYGFPTAFPIDTWILKALRRLYFPHRRPSPKQLVEFSRRHFGPNSGYAQQYLFHAVRTGKLEL